MPACSTIKKCNMNNIIVQCTGGREQCEGVMSPLCLRVGVCLARDWTLLSDQ